MDLDFFKGFAEHVFKNNDGINGMNIFIPKTKAVMVVVLGGPEEKESFINEFFREYCFTNAVDSFCILSEAWMAQMSKGDKFVMPSEHPDKIEVVICSIITKEKASTVLAPIISADTMRVLGPWQELPDTGESPVWQKVFYHPENN